MNFIFSSKKNHVFNEVNILSTTITTTTTNKKQSVKNSIKEFLNNISYKIY